MTSTISPATGRSRPLPPDVEAARAAGRQLAQELPLPPASANGHSVEAMVRAGLSRLPLYRIQAEIVRSRPNCVVVRSASPAGDESERSCALIAAWLESLPWLAYRAPGTVVESSCTTRGGKACIHTLLWQVPATAAPATSRAPAPAPSPAAAAPLLTPAAAASPAPAPAPTTSAPTPAAAPTTSAPTPAAAPAPAASGNAAPVAAQGTAERRREARPTLPDRPGEAADSWVGRASIAFRSLNGAPPANGTASTATAATASARAAADVVSNASDPAVTDRLAAGVPAAEDAALEPATGQSATGQSATGQSATGQSATGEQGAEQGAAESAAVVDAPAPAPPPAPVTAAKAAHRAEVVPLAAAPRGEGAGPAIPAREAAAMTAKPRRRPGTRRWAWARRRAWLLAIGMVAGSAGGYLASHHHVPSYTSTAMLVVRSGASPTGPGSANDAGALAITDAALLPSDQAVLGQVASTLHVPAATVSHAIVAQAVAGTALIQVRYTASSPVAAVAGANALADAVAGPRPNDQAIPNGSVAEVSKAKTASSSGALYKYALPLGAILGLLLGAGTAMAAERGDRRVDEPEALNEASNCPVTVVPGGVSPTELARALDKATGGAPVTLVPVRRGQLSAAQQLLRELRAAWPQAREAEDDGRPTLAVTMPFAEAPDAIGRREGPTVLVVGAGERQRVVHEVGARLRLLDRAPVWSVLVVAG